MNTSQLQTLIHFRHIMHMNPESAFQEYHTQKRIQEYLFSIGVQESQIRICAGTGLVVDFIGTAEPSGRKRTIAFRADIDALKMDEANAGLEYRSINGCAHMCGHDGHTACLLGFATLLMVMKMPSNKTVRLLFQPAEESIGGAIVMIQEGCLDGVDEVYGFHQWPSAKLGELWVKPGPMMSDPVIFKIKIIGRGGHASEPHKFNNPVSAGVSFIQKISEVFDAIQLNGTKFTYCFPIFQAGKACNVIPDEAIIEGMVRSLEDGFGDQSVQLVEEQLKQSTLKYGCSYDLVVEGKGYRLTSNTLDEAEHIRRLGDQFFGIGKATPGPCPVYASEDFGWFNHTVPGAFFFLSSGKHGQGDPMLHQSNFNFNDDLIDIASRFWVLVAKDRLEIK